MATRPWTPSDLSGATAVLLWHAKDITQAAGALPSWIDRIAGLAATQSTAANQPIYGATAFNGGPGVTFDGSNDVLIASNPNGLPIGTTDGGICAVIRTNAVTSLSTVTGYGGPNQNAHELTTQDGNFRLRVGTAEATLAGGAVGTNRMLVGLGLNNGSSIYVDGNPTPATAGPTTKSPIAGNVYIGGRAVFGDWNWNGTLAILLYISGTVSAADRQRLEGWLAWEAGLSANLPAGHPYKAAAPTVTTADPVRRRRRRQMLIAA